MFWGPSTLLIQGKKLFPIYQPSLLQESDTFPTGTIVKHQGKLCLNHEELITSAVFTQIRVSGFAP